MKLLDGVGRGLRVLQADLWNFTADPLPPLSKPRPLRWTPHVIVWFVAVFIVFADTTAFGHNYLGQPLGTALRCVQAAAVILALRRPMAALWLSLGATALSAGGTWLSMDAGGDGTGWSFAEPGQAQTIHMMREEILGQDIDHVQTAMSLDGWWPWGVGLVAHALVLLLLALRAPVRVALEALLVSSLLSVGLMLSMGPPVVPWLGAGVLAPLVFAAVVVLGAALRGKQVASSQLDRQRTLTTQERARRTLVEERSRIARELHDVVAHHMSVISIQAQVAAHLVEDPSDEVKESLGGIRQNAVEALTELRRVLGVLRMEDPDDPEAMAPHAPQPTLDRLDALMANTRSAGLEVTCEVTGERRPLSPGVELSAFRIVQEALSNALRHAPGSAVRVEVAHQGPGVSVRVVNTAPAAPAPPSQGAGHGLLGIRERAAMFGGDFTAGPTADGGYEVTAFLPREGIARARNGDGSPARPADSGDSSALV